jgi:tRNA-specific adenosine deaminase 1
VSEATTRAFSTEGRLKALTADVISKWPDGYSFRPFRIVTVSDEFQYSRRLGNPGQTLLPSNKSAIYTPYFQEVIIGGVLQGRKQADPRGASAVSRRKIWQAVLTVVNHLTVLEVNDDNGPFGISANCVLDRGHWIAQCDTYCQLKHGSLPYGRSHVKGDIITALGGWGKNEGDDAFSLEASTLS